MEDFETVDFPPRLPQNVDFGRASVVRKVSGRSERKPVCVAKYKSYLDAEGRIADEYGFRKEIFKCKSLLLIKSIVFLYQKWLKSCLFLSLIWLLNTLRLYHK